MFTLDYSLWFDFLLPGLDRLRIPMPLGGTSNHFKVNALRAIHGCALILAVDLARGLSRPLATHPKPMALGEDPAWG
jgi:hypothetical protein